MAGVDIRTVRELMGHKCIEMAMRYSRLSPDHKKRAIDIIEREIESCTAGKTAGKTKSADSQDITKFYKSLISKELESVSL